MNLDLFIEPLDVLALRGNRLFGDAGSHGQSLMPPWPSVAAGALRSQILAHEGIDPRAFAAGAADHPGLGTPAQPGPFTLTAFNLARRTGGKVEPLYPPPADLIIQRVSNRLAVERLHPRLPAAGIQTSSPLASIAVLSTGRRGKPVGGHWLTAAAWSAYLAGHPVAPEQLVAAIDLWRLDHRVGVGLDPVLQRADDGKLFSVSVVVMGRDAGFLARVTGVQAVPGGTLRFGGDGRGAAVSSAEVAWPQPDLQAIASTGRARLVLTAPGLFSQGWLPEGAQPQGDASVRFEAPGVRARIVCAAVARAEVVSGFDIALHQPKTALRAAPSGSVYWLDELDASAEALGKLAERGLWPGDRHDDPRRAEGFNRFTFATF